jgi:hypothetical protein
MTTNDALLELITQTREELAVVRDNHLHHLAEDITRIGTDVEVIKERLKPIEKHVESIEGIIRSYAQKGMIMVIAGTMAGMGYVSM